MSIQCPKCHSTRIGKNNYGKKTAGSIGAAGGTIGGYAATVASAKAGAAPGAFAGPPGIAIGGLGGLIIGALFGGAAGASVGVILGDILDENVLDNHRCLDCGHCFSGEPTTKPKLPIIRDHQP
ncbi:MAG: hypothetical protein LAT65_15730 [Saccharospirillum sp.]|nr:hypothetical protein [Saccharospirillum sp.]